MISIIKTRSLTSCVVFALLIAESLARRPQPDWVTKYLALTPSNEPCLTADTCPAPNTAICDNGFCNHKGVFPMTANEIVGTVLLPILLGFSNVGGLGGGGLIIPVCVGFFGFTTI